MKKLLILGCLICVSGNITFAAMGGYDAGLLNQQYTRDMRTHEFATRAKSRSAIVDVAEKKSNENSNTTSNIPNDTILKSVTFVNNYGISTRDLNRIVSYSLNKPATMENIANIRSLLTRYYQANGYYSVVIMPNTKNIDNGELIIEINEGSKNSIVIE